MGCAIIFLRHSDYIVIIWTLLAQFNWSDPLVYRTALLCLVLVPQIVIAQTRTKIAVLSAQNGPATGYVSPADQLRMNVAAKEVDAIVSKLAGNPNLEVLDRTQIQALEAEQDNKLNDRFDATQAPKLGKLLGANVLVYVSVEGFDANVSQESKDQFVYIKTTVTGKVHLSVHATAIAVDTAAVLSAPSSNVDLTQVLSESKSQKANGFIPQARGNLNADHPEILQLVEKAINQAATELASNLSALSSNSAPARPAAVPKVAGIDQGKVMVNRGTTSGLGIGQKYEVIRMVDSGFKDPDTGQEIIKKKKICELTLTDVDDSLTYGTCLGDIPQSGDQLLNEGSK